ncbi:MAG TPA: hypothetical protein VGO40_21405 [Longimicrobium sp.]|jgi:hypothetical protein|nr:hypothetical protein [Longimicrobium sp.]
MDEIQATRRSWYHRLLRVRRKSRQVDAPVSERTLQMIDEAAENFRRGNVGPPVDPERLKRLAS